MKDDTYELCFNKACLLISQNMFNEAEKKLKDCEKLCKETLEADEEDQQIEMELAHIKYKYFT